jgi:hypothetical protein
MLDPLYLTYTHHLALIYKELGRYGSQTLLMDTGKKRLSIFPLQHEDTMTSLTSLATFYRSGTASSTTGNNNKSTMIANYEKAEYYYEKLLQAYRLRFNNNNNTTTTTNTVSSPTSTTTNHNNTMIEYCRI